MSQAAGASSAEHPPAKLETVDTGPAKAISRPVANASDAGRRNAVRGTLLWVGATVAISAAFSTVAAYNLANYRPVSNDEVELMAVGYKLAFRGVLGSDMYAGFSGGDQHHFETLPLQHVLQAISFRVFGPGIAQARLVSLVAAIALVWAVGWLAFRWYGLAAAIVAELLLVGWRSDLTAAWSGLPLFGAARTARYDVLAVTLAWLSLAALDLALRRPRILNGLATGALAGLATLSQFFGAFVLPVVLLGALWRSRRVCAAVIAGAVVTVVPYAIYAARHLDDVRGQLSVFGDRFQLSPQSVLSEPERYRHLLDAPWLLVIGIWPALAYIAWRSRQPRALGDRLLLLGTFVFAAGLAVVDRTKVPLYAILLLPSVSVGIAAATVALLTAAWRPGQVVLRVVVSGIALITAASLVAESVSAYKRELTAADEVTPYLSYGQRIDAFLEPGAAVLGPERWWWALHDHPYTSLRSLWFQWAAAANQTGRTPDFADWVVGSGAEHLIVNNNVRDDIRAFPEPLQRQFWSFMDHCTTQLADMDDANYRVIEIYRINDTC